MIDFLNEQWWVAILLLAILTLANLYLSGLSRKVYEAHAQPYIVYSADDISSNQEKMKKSHLFSSQNVYLFLVVVLLVVARLFYGKEFFELFYGAVLWATIYGSLKYLENILIYLDMSKPGRVMGHIIYSRPFVQKISSVNLFSLAVVLGIAALVIMRPFFWGGALYCLFLGFRELREAKKALLVK